MRRYLLVALLPAGLSVIAAATALVARRASATSVPGAAGRTALPDIAEELGRDALKSAVAAIERRPGGVTSAKSEILPGLVRLGALTGVGGLVAYNIMAKLGPPIVKYGLAIDNPVFEWTKSHKVDWWTKGVARFNNIGNTWSTWGAVASAAACLSISWPRQRWLPPSALGAAILVDYLSTHRLHRTIKRTGPPTSPEGTYPSGGTDRVVLFYGLIAYLLWAEFNGTHPGRVWTVGSVSGLAFLTAYCRQYLGEHWFIDIVCGVVYGGMLLAPIVIAVEQITGPAKRRATAPA